MNQKPILKFDKIGYWSEVKLDIIKDYAAAYSRILSGQTRPRFSHISIDAFAGAGIHISRRTGEFVPGSPVHALHVQPPFHEYHLIDLDRNKVGSLRQIIGERSDVQIYEGDCNPILLAQVFPRVRFEDYRRGLCLLDPYGLHLQWAVIAAAGQMRSLDIFINFPVADMNRNVLWHHPEDVNPTDIERMDSFWGDDTWRSIAYTTERSLCGFQEKVENEAVAEGFRTRLQQVAGFKHVQQPLPMRNSRGAIVYYLFFASQKPVAANIVEDIFQKYQTHGAR